MPAGRPPKYKTAEELQEAIDNYFNTGVTVRKVLIGKKPNQQLVDVEVPTITGLTYYLGFESRTAFYDYEKKAEFKYTIKKARLFIEKEYEEQLSVGNTVGAIFALKNMGWMDKPADKPIDDIGNALKEIADAISKQDTLEKPTD